MKTKKLISVLFTLFITSSLLAQSGGPDAFGYTWKDQSAAGGPVYTWKDIKSIGTQITGLGDDNQKGPFNLGWSFRYYWTNYNKVWIGSNGWIGFQNNTILPAAPIPTIPTAGLPNNYIAALSSDLTFTQFNSSAVPGATAWYWSNNTDTLIVQYDSIPYWVTGSLGYSGRYTFQAILSGADSSITYHYKLTQTGTVPYAMATEGLTTGIENSTGQIGLQVLTNTFPSASTAVKFYYPNPVTYQVFDATPAWNQNVDNGGFFVSRNNAVNLTTDVLNAGNQPISNIGVSSQLLDASLTAVWTSTLTVTSLTAGADSMITHSTPYNASTAGTYTYRSTTTLSSDINPANDITNVEMVVVDTSSASIGLAYSALTTPTGTQSTWGGNGGQGIYIEPPFYPATIDSLEFMVTASDITGYHLVHIVDDNGIGNTPGTILYLDSVAASAAVAGVYNNVPVTTPITITSGGVYVAWLENGDAISAIGTDATPPLSYRNYEILGGAWSSYRNNGNDDIQIKVNIGKYKFVGAIATSSTQDGCPTNSTGSATASVTGGNAPFTYTWNPGGQTTATATGLAAGSYSVNVTDTFGGTATAIVTVYNNIAVTALAVDILCFGATNGTATATIGGTAPYTYLWSPGGQTTQTATGLTAGVYTVTATNTDGCMNIAWDTVMSPAAIAATYSVTNATCVGNNGSATATVTGGTGSYTYSWSTIPAQTTATATGLAAGTYTISIQDANGCTGSSTVTITTTPFVISATSVPPTSCNGTNGSATGTATSGGTGPYTYVWSTGPVQTTQTATGLSPGSYTVMITDANGCTGSTTVTLTNTPFIISSSSTVISCFNGTNGTATATATSGGTASYTYAWTTTPPQATQTATGLGAGSYTCLVTDANGCTAVTTVTLTNPTIVVVVTSTTPAPATPTGTAFANASGGTGPYTYLWTPSGQTTPTATGLLPGTYTVCVTDSKNCTICNTATVVDNTGIIEIYSGATITISPNPFNSSAQVKIDFVNPVHNGLIFTVYDIYGREIQSIDLNNMKGPSIDFTLNRGYNIPNGLYFYRLMDSEGILSAGKLIVQ